MSPDASPLVISPTEMQASVEACCRCRFHPGTRATISRMPRAKHGRFSRGWTFRAKPKPTRGGAGSTATGSPPAIDARPWRRSDASLADLLHDEPRRVDWLMGFAMLVRREAFEAVGVVRRILASAPTSHRLTATLDGSSMTVRVGAEQAVEVLDAERIASYWRHWAVIQAFRQLKKLRPTPSAATAPAAGAR